jgi:hypothetical protein
MAAEEHAEAALADQFVLAINVFALLTGHVQLGMTANQTIFKSGFAQTLIVVEPQLANQQRAKAAYMLHRQLEMFFTLMLILPALAIV